MDSDQEPNDKSYLTIDNELRVKIKHDVETRALRRRTLIEERVDVGDFGCDEVCAGLRVFNRLCDEWAIDSACANTILFGELESARNSDTASLVERISYVLRIYRLVGDVVQGDSARARRWIRRASTSLGGARPIDLIAAGPTGAAVVMEYLQHCRLGLS